ncbi:MAG: hypothetical protein JWR52_3313 [Marmoricola sp.]|nr:hypothetical protein [Marmoricola sp.]
MVAAVVVLIVVVASVYWFAIRDSGNDKKVTTNAEQTFTAPGRSFSFKYPGSFVQKTGIGAKGYIWIAGVGAYDLLDVKRLDNKPTSAARIETSVRQTLAAQIGTVIVSEGTDQRGGIPMVTFQVQSTINGLPLHSKLIYFTANAVTWQLECESQSQGPTIDAACARALATFTAIAPQPAS